MLIWTDAGVLRDGVKVSDAELRRRYAPCLALHPDSTEDRPLVCSMPGKAHGGDHVGWSPAMKRVTWTPGDQS